MNRNFSVKLTASQLERRIRLAEKRTLSYPMDDMDFILMDVEHPKDKKRHAHQCSGDLTGRTIEFWSVAHSVLNNPDDAKLTELYRRSFQAEKPSDYIMRFAPYCEYANDFSAYEFIKENIDKLADAAKGLTEEEAVEKLPFYFDYASIIQAMAYLYGWTGDKKYLDLIKIYEKKNTPQFQGAHGHATLVLMRSLALAARISGDLSFLETPKKFIDKIISDGCLYYDGSLSEEFPHSRRNEGCTIADWIILNLRYAFLTGDESAYDRAEDSLYNALYFNQFITGGFGHRNYAYRGYTPEIEEAWWCCTESAGVAMSIFAKYSVIRTDKGIRINYLVPGVYTLNENGRIIKVTVSTSFPDKFEAKIKVEGGDLPVEVRVPYYVKNYARTDAENDGAKSITVSGDIGHYYEKRNDAYVLKYGVGILAPMVYNWNSEIEDKTTSVPEGYVAKKIDSMKFTVLEKDYDKNGFLKLEREPYPFWGYYEEGVNARLAIKNASVNVKVRLADGQETTLFFQPMLCATSNLTLRSFPVAFDI